MYNTPFIPQVQGYLGSLQDKTEVFVGVHVRRTDYLDWIIDKYEVSMYTYFKSCTREPGR